MACSVEQRFGGYWVVLDQVDGDVVLMPKTLPSLPIVFTARRHAERLADAIDAGDAARAHWVIGRHGRMLDLAARPR